MKSIIVRIADINIKINYQYGLVKDMCKDYIFDDENIDLICEANKADFEKYRKESNDEYGEFLAIHESIARKLADYNRTLIHGAAIAYNNLAYLFLAPSGVGKSTHIKIWKDNITGISIINGDKPIIDENGYIYGTPWAGKEKWNSNIKCKLAGVVLLHRGLDNSIIRINKNEYLNELLSQIYRNNNFDRSISIFDKAINNIPLYYLSCNTNVDAAKVCFDTIVNNK